MIQELVPTCTSEKQTPDAIKPKTEPKTKQKMLMWHAKPPHNNIKKENRKTGKPNLESKTTKST
jgi:hypothetical protein